MMAPCYKLPLMSNVTEFPWNGVGRVPPENVLDGARDAGCYEVIVIGYDREQREYFASSTSDGPRMLWMIERFKQAILRNLYMESDDAVKDNEASAAHGRVCARSNVQELPTKKRCEGVQQGRCRLGNSETQET